MAFEGTLKDFSLTEIFQLISYQKKTGTLTLKGKGKKAYITFVHGNIICAETFDDRLEDRLGYRLVRSNLLSEEQLKSALNIQKETLQRLGFILVSKKYISQEDLERNLRDIISEKIYRLFRWKEGEYHFTVSDDEEFEDDYFRPISTQSVLMEAVQMIDEWPLIEKRIPSFDIIFDKIKDKSIQVIQEKEEEPEEFSLTEELFNEKADIFADEKEESKVIKLSSNEYKVFKAINGVRNVTEIIEYCNMSDFDTSRALYDLLDRNLIYKKEEKRPVLAVTEKKEIKEKKAVASNLPFYLILGLLSVFSIFIIARKIDQIIWPFSFINPAVFNPNKSSSDYLKIKKISMALDTYYLLYSTYPPNLRRLVQRGLLHTEEIQDSQENEYAYQLLEDRYIIASQSTPNNPSRLIHQKFFIAQ